MENYQYYSNENTNDWSNTINWKLLRREITFPYVWTNTSECDQLSSLQGHLGRISQTSHKKKKSTKQIEWHHLYVTQPFPVHPLPILASYTLVISALRWRPFLNIKHEANRVDGKEEWNLKFDCPHIQEKYPLLDYHSRLFLSGKQLHLSKLLCIKVCGKLFNNHRVNPLYYN